VRGNFRLGGGSQEDGYDQGGYEQDGYGEGLGESEWYPVGDESSFGVSLGETSGSDIVIELTLNGFYRTPEVIDGKTYYHVSLPNEPVRQEVGAPALPFVARSLIIPDDQLMTVTVDSSEFVDLGDMPVAPSKGPLPMGVDPDTIAYDFGDIYQSDSLFPEEVDSLGSPFIMRDFRGLLVYLNAFQARPLGDTLRVYTHMTVRLAAAGQDTTNVIQRTGLPQAIDRQFATLYPDVFLNYTDLCDRGFNPALREGRLLLIVSDDAAHNWDFRDQIAPLVQWKLQRGTPTTVVPMSAFCAVPEPSVLRDSLIARYERDPLIAYVLLVGDWEQVPTLIEHYQAPSYLEGCMPEDPWYTLLVGSDNYPDVFVGRFSADLPWQVETQVERTIAYERDQNSSDGWLGEAFGMADHGIMTPPGPEHEPNDEWMGDRLQDLENSQLYDTTHLYDYEQPDHQGEFLLNSLNSGQGLFLASAHGCTAGWGTAFPTDPVIKRERIYNNNDQGYYLRNERRLPIVDAQSCDLGKFTDVDQDAHPGWPKMCFAEAWMWARTAPGLPKGATAAYMASGGLAQVGPQWAHQETVDLFLTAPVPTVGAMTYGGAIYMMNHGVSPLHFRMWNLFGDPSLLARRGVPRPMAVSHPGYLRAKDTEYSVEVKDATTSMPIGGACCAVYGDGVLYGAAVTAYEGLVTIPLASRDTPSELTLTVTATGGITVEDVIHPALLVDGEGNGDEETIQGAIDSADDGWVILLTDDVYSGEGNRDLDCGTKSVSIESRSGDPLACRIECGGGSETVLHSGVSYGGAGAGERLRLKGLTIAGGYHAGGGGAVHCESDGGTCTLEAEDCVCEENHGGDGGGLFCEGAVALRRCTIARNVASGKGGGLYCEGELSVANCTFACDSADVGSAMYFGGEVAGTVARTIMAFGGGEGALGCDEGAIVGMACSDVFGNEGGDEWGCVQDQGDSFSEDPRFCDMEGEDYHLWNYSPCYREETEECGGLIGAWGIGCTDPESAEELTKGMGAGFGAIGPVPTAANVELRFSLGSVKGEVRHALGIYDVMGRCVRTLAVTPDDLGSGSVVWDGRDDSGDPVAAGPYFCRLTLGSREFTRRVMVLR